jgi:hypothetical protein
MAEGVHLLRATPAVTGLCASCATLADGVALPQFLPQSARRDHQCQRINLQLSGCQRVSKHAAPVTGGRVVAGSNPVSPTQVRGGFYTQSAGHTPQSPYGFWQYWQRLSRGAKIGLAVAVDIVLLIIASIVISAEPWHSQKYKECEAAYKNEGYKGDDLKRVIQYCVDSRSRVVKGYHGARPGHHRLRATVAGCCAPFNRRGRRRARPVVRSTNCSTSA